MWLVEGLECKWVVHVVVVGCHWECVDGLNLGVEGMLGLHGDIVGLEAFVNGGWSVKKAVLYLDQSKELR